MFLLEEKKKKINLEISGVVLGLENSVPRNGASRIGSWSLPAEKRAFPQFQFFPLFPHFPCPSENLLATSNTIPFFSPFSSCSMSFGESSGHLKHNSHFSPFSSLSASFGESPGHLKHNSHFFPFFLTFHVLWGISWSPQIPSVQTTKLWEVLGPCFLVVLEEGISIPTVLRLRVDQILSERFHVEHVFHPNLRIMESSRLEKTLRIIKPN